MIEVANLSKRYGDLRAIEGVSFTAVKGQILGFLGPNGAGKTTTMRIITGFMPATSGTVRVEGFDVAGMKPVMIRIVVVLPAPLGPRKPRIWPLPAVNETPSMALRSP